MLSFATFLRDESGATAVEYGLIVALVSATAIGAYGALGNAMEAMYGVVESAVLGVVP